MKKKLLIKIKNKNVNKERHLLFIIDQFRINQIIFFYQKFNFFQILLLIINKIAFRTTWKKLYRIFI